MIIEDYHILCGETVGSPSTNIPKEYHLNLVSSIFPGDHHLTTSILVYCQLDANHLEKLIKISEKDYLFGW
jgi:hypothetical protein